MRGKPFRNIPNNFLQRITPAHAGKTLPAPSACRTTTDHPRACGENDIKSSKGQFYNGSPPRMRGKRDEDGESREVERITPAHAGKTPADAAKRGVRPDHPRACGENFPSNPPPHQSFGSPPRMRGKQLSAVDDIDYLRITPAHAGKTRIFVSVNFITTDHPRACGENVFGI